MDMVMAITEVIMQRELRKNKSGYTLVHILTKLKKRKHWYV